MGNAGRGKVTLDLTGMKQGSTVCFAISLLIG